MDHSLIYDFTDEQWRHLAEKYGPSFYIFDSAWFICNLEHFRNCFTKYYANTRLGYSYKTNYHPRICALALQQGAYAEVVSRMEYDLALRIGNDPKDIIFNGPWKSEDDLSFALINGSIVNIDGHYEIDHIEAIARVHKEFSFRVGLRVGFDVGNDKPTRFGFDVDSGSLEQAVKRLRRIKNIRLAGLHCHFLLPNRHPDEYRAVARRMISLADDIFDGEMPEYINLGGGFFSRMPESMQRQFDRRLPDQADYGKAIGEEFAAHYGDSGPQLVLEPGLAVIADTMFFVARILDVKVVDSQRYALCTGSVYNVRPTKSLRNLSLRIVACADFDPQDHHEFDVVGYTCMEDDVLHRGYSGAIAPGDIAVFGNVGAYTIVLKPPFILPNVPIYEYDRPHFEVLRQISREQTLDELICNVVPHG